MVIMALLHLSPWHNFKHVHLNPITYGHSDDRKPIDALTSDLKGRIIGDKDYISKVHTERL